MNGPLWDQDVWRDIWVPLQEHEAVLTVFHIPAHKALTHPINQGAGALVWI